MDKYEFENVLLPRLAKSFEKVKLWLRDGDTARAQDVSDIWYEMLKTHSLHDALEAVQALVCDENQPRQADGYPRRLRAILEERVRSRNGGRHPEDPAALERYMEDMEARANTWRQRYGLPPLEHPRRLCTPQRALEISEELAAAGAIPKKAQPGLAASENRGSTPAGNRDGINGAMPYVPPPLRDDPPGRPTTKEVSEDELLY